MHLVGLFLRIVYISWFVLLSHFSLTTNNLNLMKGCRHSSKGTLHTTVSKGLVLICSARGVPMSSGRVHAPATHIDWTSSATGIPTVSFHQKSTFFNIICALYIWRRKRKRIVPPPPFVAPGRAHCCWDSIQYPVPSFPYPPLKC